MSGNMQCTLEQQKYGQKQKGVENQHFWINFGHQKRKKKLKTHLGAGTGAGHPTSGVGRLFFSPKAPVSNRRGATGAFLHTTGAGHLITGADCPDFCYKHSYVQKIS
ncbi:unnamed protein product [Cuscuta europaea]|uniref:Uncharacterized protein n=1 Tax=Cuscuta europaea TaxID=41803 RepID=A0A9P0ZYG0_CUSEU|nr:unnamed protein product [Cuscuta europaea]